MTECFDPILPSGISASGLHSAIPLSDRPNELIPIILPCYFNDGGWIVFQRRVSESDFYFGWDTYVKGFGNYSDNLWLGLEAIHRLTSLCTSDCEMYVYLESHEPGDTAYAYYSSFTLQNITSNYTINHGGYEGKYIFIEMNTLLFVHDACLKQFGL